MWWRRWWSRLNARRGEHPVLLANRNYFDGFDYGSHVWDYDFVVFDTELTGLNPRLDEIVSIGAVRVRDRHVMIEESFHSLLRTKRTSFGEGTLVHRIAPQDIRRAPQPEKILPKFVDFCGKSVLIGHLPILDLSFLDKACRRSMGGIIMNPCLDSMELARTLLKDQKSSRDSARRPVTSLNLTELAQAYRIPRFVTHDALGDALQTACLFIFLVERLSRCGLRTLKDFRKAGYPG
ncbi:MAG: 3'-5' exonuclease [Thermodesulfobacteriota bacterium]